MFPIEREFFAEQECLRMKWNRLKPLLRADPGSQIPLIYIVTEDLIDETILPN
jgi:hypothetical protein